MADEAIFLHGLEKTKNSNAEKRFPIFMFNLVIIKALNFSLMFVFVVIAGLIASFDGDFSFSFAGGGCKAIKCIDNG
ncbi:hypothetical protein [Aeromonas veronii]|uniref:hypothetical protein n=1 Tax=Aeromonas veronii TaxID=654 RepID=UPI002B495380|nr:hypothetical protein [Aeromonas veronii]